MQSYWKRVPGPYFSWDPLLSRELFYFSEVKRVYNNNPITILSQAKAEIPEFYRLVRQGEFTMGGLKTRFLLGVVSPAGFIGLVSYILGKTFALGVRPANDVLGVKDHH